MTFKPTCDPSAITVPLRRIGRRALALSGGSRRKESTPKLLADRYRIQSLLGRGGMGAVWLASDEVLRRPVAIKESTIPETVLERALAKTRLLQEAQAASKVRHPGVVQVYDVAMADGRSWIVMEALSGPTMAQVMRREGSLPVGRVVDIALQLLDALRAVHRAGVIHRDVKPSNVQLCETGRVVLTDFGVATAAEDATEDQPGQLFGSPPYTAPEAIAGRHRFGPASDLFSVGAILYAAVEGRQPFNDLTLFSTLQAVMHESPRRAVQAGPLGPVIDGLLVKDPDDRMSLQEAYDRLKAIEADLASGPTAFVEPARRPGEGPRVDHAVRRAA